MIKLIWTLYPFVCSIVIDGIYEALENFGFKGGNILEPAMGVGNFFGRMPEEMQADSRLYGVEIDSISGRIAKQLYPDADIAIQGFEKNNFQNGCFDVAVGNVPFGELPFKDDKHHTTKLHDYFFVETLDKVKNGGIVAFVTSAGTLDKRDESTRKALSEKADFIGAIRLPGGKNGAFKDNAGTEVTTDIIFLQKNENKISESEKESWLSVGETADGLPINNYFAENPDMVLGKVVEGNKLYGSGTMVACWSEELFILHFRQMIHTRIWFGVCYHEMPFLPESAIYRDFPWGQLAANAGRAKQDYRVYTAEDFTSYLSSLICNGILDTYGDNFLVTASGNLSVVIGTGKAWIGGHYFINDMAYTLDLRQYVDESLSRYVTIGISCDVSDSVRSCKLEVKSGTAATSPSVPAFENTDTKTYLTLASVRLNGGITSISQSNIKDYRSDEKKCGYVKCILGKCKVSEILAALDSYNKTVTELNNRVAEFQERLAEVEEICGTTGVILVSAGQCGENAFYALYSDGSLKLYGSGATYDYSSSNSSPFDGNQVVQSITVSSGITKIGNKIFADCDNLKTVSLLAECHLLHIA